MYAAISLQYLLLFENYIYLNSNVIFISAQVTELRFCCKKTKNKKNHIDMPMDYHVSVAVLGCYQRCMSKMSNTAEPKDCFVDDIE